MTTHHPSTTQKSGTRSEQPVPISFSLLRLPAVLKARGRSRSSHYEDVRQGLFTNQISIGPRAVAWPEHEVVALNAARISGKSEEEIRALVKRLEAERQSLSWAGALEIPDPPGKAPPSIERMGT